MNVQVIGSGIAGTLAMTAFMELTAYLVKQPFHVVSILARMLAFNKQHSTIQGGYTIYAIALMIHYTIGILFTWGFVLLVRNDFLTFNGYNALAFGALAGGIGIAGWRLFIAVHPNPPKINYGGYLVGIWLGHIVFAIVQFFALYLTMPEL